VASIFFTIIGIWVGFYYMDKELSLNYKRIFTGGIEFYKMLYGKVKMNFNRQQ
jgi:hypothetical protein